jgi:hypothetical protein
MWPQIGYLWSARKSVMKDVGVRKFRDRASSYLSGDEPLAVRRHGRLLGFYVPVKRKTDAEELRTALREARDSLAELRRESGHSEEELVEDLASGKPEERGRERVGG